MLEPAVSLNVLRYVSHGTCAQSMKASEIWQLFGKRCSSICGVLLIFEPFFCPLWLGPMPIGVHGKLQLNWMSFADPVLYYDQFLPFMLKQTEAAKQTAGGG